MGVLKAFGLALLVPVVLVVCFAFGFGARYVGMKMHGFFYPAYVEIETDAYRNTRSYIDGVTRDLRQLQREYNKADAAGKAALKTIIFQRADEIDRDKLPADVLRFLDSITC